MAFSAIYLKILEGSISWFSINRNTSFRDSQLTPVWTGLLNSTETTSLLQSTVDLFDIQNLLIPFSVPLSPFKATLIKNYELLSTNSVLLLSSTHCWRMGHMYQSLYPINYCNTESQDSDATSQSPTDEW